MTPRSRVVSALRREPVDRVPIMEMGIDWAVMRGLGFDRYLDMIEALDLDGVCANQALYFLGWRRFVFPHLKHYTDEWGVKSRFTGELLPIPVGHPAPTPEALERLRPPDPARSPLLKAIRQIRKRMPDRAVTMLSRNDFAASWFLCGMDVLLMAYIENPDFAKRLAETVNDYYCTLYRLAVEAGVDVIYLTDDLAYKTGTLFSREHFQEFVLPWLQRGVDAVHQAGALCIKHTDGNISNIFDLIVNTGVDAVGPLEPDAGNDLPALQEQWGDRVALIGNVDVDVLCRGSRNDVEAVTQDLVQALARRGGHVLSSGNTITAAVKPENFLAMIESARNST